MQFHQATLHLMLFHSHWWAPSRLSSTCASFLHFSRSCNSYLLIHSSLITSPFHCHDYAYFILPVFLLLYMLFCDFDCNDFRPVLHHLLIRSRLVLQLKKSECFEILILCHFLYILIQCYAATSSSLPCSSFLSSVSCCHCSVFFSDLIRQILLERFVLSELSGR